ncbi:hypothetical protein Vadar_022897 [Vaccinium darrowii]|uniref:Uncharacterized protein n=1 Tax=Vaccinium darrowii TaxID=229202 RepID=A0ACB7X346_9ERIC|nr:hypothetical protein Vadar_022897 [Vaccinium darrowii]
MGSSSLPNGLLSLSLAVFLLLHLFPSGSASHNEPLISYHNGPLLTGNVSLAILWYGEFMPVEKIVVQTFIESLSMRPSKSFQADVHSWWKKVGSYLEVAEKKSPKSVVQIARQVYDESASLGYDLGSESLPALLHKATVGLANTVAVIFVSKDVKMAETCTVPCYLHGVHGSTNQTNNHSVVPGHIQQAISRCNSTGGPVGRFWVLDPIDGTLGFVRGDQYAVALALIEDGEVVLGVLGCPNYPMKKEWLSYHNRYHRIIYKLSPPTSESWERGCVFYARRGSGNAWMQPLLHGEEKLLWPNNARQIQVSSIDDPAFATFCEPVEKANSSHSFSAGLAHSVGLR